MFLLSRRAVHTALAGGAAALAYAAAAELGSRKPVRVGGLLLLGMTGMAAMAASKASVKAVAVSARVDNLVSTGIPAAIASGVSGYLPLSGGTISGSLTVTGNSQFQNAHVGGTLYGVSGTITAGDNFYTSGVLTANGTITTHGNFSGSSTTGVGTIGALTGLNGTNHCGTSPGTYSQSSEQAIANRVNNLQDDVASLVSYVNGGVDGRINDFINALG